MMGENIVPGISKILFKGEICDILTQTLSLFSTLHMPSFPVIVIEREVAANFRT